MRVIGTAGHVDHGKSTLVEALTGTHPDRLKEEREREMTIDLGFAWLILPNGEEVGIVDVPGHRDFIENMLAGIGGIDAALFVIAADEGIMPQTKEHLAILDLLQIQGGVIALTKIDLVNDPDWLDLIEADIRKTFLGTVLDSVALVRVSARRGLGLQELLEKLTVCLDNKPPRTDQGRPRLPVDRVFSMPGFGTVVTGTLTDGHLSIGDEVEVLPQGLHGRVRGLQGHKRKAEKALPGSRTAINIAGVSLDQVTRGNVITYPGAYQPTRRVDVQFRLLVDASQPVKHNMSMKMFVGTSEVIARLRLLGKETILPGEQGWLQLELDNPIIVNRGDHYILRRPSPSETIGGGSIVDTHPKERHKRFVQGVLDQLQSLAQGSPSERLLQVVTSSGMISKREALSRAGLDDTLGGDAFNELLSDCLMMTLVSGDPITQINNDTLVVSKAYWDRANENLLLAVQNYHLSSPLRIGMPREELKSRLKIPLRLFNTMVRYLVSHGNLVDNGANLHLPEHEIRFTMEQQRRLDVLMTLFMATPNSPPSIKECHSLVGDDLYNAWIELGELVPVSSEVVFRKSDYDCLKAEVVNYLQKNGTITVAEARDMFNTSRRYILAFLEHLDLNGITVRDGDVRRLLARPSSR